MSSERIGPVDLSIKPDPYNIVGDVDFRRSEVMMITPYSYLLRAAYPKYSDDGITFFDSRSKVSFPLGTGKDLG